MEHVECLTGYEGAAFASLDNIEQDLLVITSVHPMRRDAVVELLEKTGADWSVIEGLIHRNQLVELEYQGEKFYVAKLQ